MVRSLHSMNIGAIGELAVRQELLNQNYKVYLPEVDIEHVDLLVEVENGAFKRVQVKTITKLTTATAMQVRCVKYVNSGRVDVIAVYYIPKKICAFVPYNNEKMISLAITTAKNNQKSKRQWFYQYERFPEFS